MKLKIKEQTEKEIDINFPLYFQKYNGNEQIKIVSGGINIRMKSIYFASDIIEIKDRFITERDLSDMIQSYDISSPAEFDKLFAEMDERYETFKENINNEFNNY